MNMLNLSIQQIEAIINTLAQLNNVSDNSTPVSFTFYPKDNDCIKVVLYRKGDISIWRNNYGFQSWPNIDTFSALLGK